MDSRDGHCPYWRCRTHRSFLRYEETDDDGVPIAFEYRCESCGRTFDWADDNLRSSDDGSRAEFRRRGGRHLYQ